MYSQINQAPPVKFKDLEALVTSRLVRDQVRFQYRTDFLRITSDTVLVPITIQIPTKQLSFTQKNGVESANVNLFGRITSLSGRIVNTGSTAAKVPRWEIGAYCVSKAAVLHFTRCLAMEVAQYGITVNAVYLAKSRVLRHLRTELDGFLEM